MNIIARILCGVGFHPMRVHHYYTYREFPTRYAHVQCARCNRAAYTMKQFKEARDYESHHADRD